MSGLGYISKLKEGGYEVQRVAVKQKPSEVVDKNRQIGDQVMVRWNRTETRSEVRKTATRHNIAIFCLVTR
jgi:hypothetical protein